MLSQKRIRVLKQEKYFSSSGFWWDNHKGSLEDTPGWFTEDSLTYTERRCQCQTSSTWTISCLPQGWLPMSSSSQDDKLIQFLPYTWPMQGCACPLMWWSQEHWGGSHTIVTTLIFCHSGHDISWVSLLKGMRGIERPTSHISLERQMVLTPKIQLQMSVRCVKAQGQWNSFKLKFYSKF